MKRLLCLPLIAGLLFSVVPSVAQSRCYTDEITERNLLRFPELAMQRAAMALSIENAMQGSQEGAFSNTVVQIPVVVHVVYKGPLENISDAQIQSQIDVLNADYRQQNANAGSVPAEFQPYAADVEIEFCLAAQDPNGAPTSGITRTATTWLNIGQVLAADGSPRICYTALGGEDAWAPEHYLNIWVAGIGGGILGFGTLPGTAPPQEEGIIVDPHYFGTVGLALLGVPNHLGRTATHEIGHYFNLSHIWGGNENVCTDDDGVSDTPVQRGPFLGCPVYPQFSCGNSAMFMNYMDYTDDACMSLFTKGQKARMWATLTAVRPGLLESQGCATSSTTLPPVDTGLRLFPNPATDGLTIETIEECGEVDWIRVVDIWGRERVLTAISRADHSLFVHIGNLAPGCYLLQLAFESGVVRQSVFIKQ